MTLAKNIWFRQKFSFSYYRHEEGRREAKGSKENFIDWSSRKKYIRKIIIRNLFFLLCLYALKKGKMQVCAIKGRGGKKVMVSFCCTEIKLSRWLLDVKCAGKLISSQAKRKTSSLEWWFDGHKNDMLLAMTMMRRKKKNGNKKKVDSFLHCYVFLFVHFLLFSAFCML